MDILNNIRYGVELERANMPDNGLNESPGIMNSILGSISGATKEGVDTKRSSMRNAADKREYGDLYTSTTGEPWREGMTGATALNEINEFKEQKQDKRDTKAFERSLVPQTKLLEAQAEESRLTRESQADQFRTQLQAQESRYAFDGEQRALDRSLERQLSNNSTDMQMQIAQMNADLADKRMAYDRETKRMDRRDRAIAQLMSGLGQLGGAFSL